MRLNNKLLNISTCLVQHLHIFKIQRLNPPVDFFLEITVFEEQIIRRGRDSKAFRHRKADPIKDLPQIRHLAADMIGHILVYGLKRQDQFALSEFLALFQDLFDAVLDFRKNVIEGLIAVGGDLVHVLNYLVHIDRNSSAVSANKGHAKAVAPAKGVFHVGHDMERRIIGV